MTSMMKRPDNSMDSHAHGQILTMEQTPYYDCVVIGAGIEGSATCYQLTKKGVKTLLIEQV